MQIGADTAAARHPARLLPYGELEERLADSQRRRLVFRTDSDDGLAVWAYTRRCVYDQVWDGITVLARGLVTDPAARRVVATPFPKFFNLGERGIQPPDLPFEAFEKLDGSLIIVFWHAGRWRTATKGAFRSSQSLWAQARLDTLELSALTRGTTYLFEAVYPENRIVVRYRESALVMLAAYAEDGTELSYEEVRGAAEAIGTRAAERRAFPSFRDLVGETETLPRSQEGVVVRFADGLRLKVKGAEYRRVHALASRVTPLAVWEIMQAGDDIGAVRMDLPEELWGDFDRIAGLLNASLDALGQRVSHFAGMTAGISDRDLAPVLKTMPPDVQPFVRDWRRGTRDLRASKLRKLAFRSIRPAADVLPGYQPSWAVRRFAEDAE